LAGETAEFNELRNYSESVEFAALRYFDKGEGIS